MLCQSESALLPGPCPSQARWVGPDGLVRCSLHHVQEFGHSEKLVRVEGYTPPADVPPPPPKPAWSAGKEEIVDSKA